MIGQVGIQRGKQIDREIDQLNQMMCPLSISVK